jgi:hypothetical protein
MLDDRGRFFIHRIGKRIRQVEPQVVEVLGNLDPEKEVPKDVVEQRGPKLKTGALGHHLLVHLTKKVEEEENVPLGGKQLGPYFPVPLALVPPSHGLRGQVWHLDQGIGVVGLVGQPAGVVTHAGELMGLSDPRDHEFLGSEIFFQVI